MDESVFYIGEGDPNDKTSGESFGISTSIHSSQQFASFKQANSYRNGSVLTGHGPGERLFVACKGKALINVYSWGKDAPDQRIPVPEQLTCLALAKHPYPIDVKTSSSKSSNNLPKFRIPWLLAAGGVSGRIYIWELSSGLLLAVKDAHYQAPSVLKFTECGSFLVTGGLDARLMVWRTLDLVSIYSNTNNDDQVQFKPFASFTDHTLPITDLAISGGLINDTKIYSVSRDSTLRVYDLMSKTLLSTFVSPFPIECVAKDPANRAVYIGLNNGLVRSIPLYSINQSNIIEAVGGCGKIITLDNDAVLKNSFIHHQQQPSVAKKEVISVTSLEISMDGSFLISGDSVGRVFVSDIVTRQIVKVLKPLISAVSHLQVFPVIETSAASSQNALNIAKDKSHRLITQFKRVLPSEDVNEHVSLMEIPKPDETSFDFNEWANEVAHQELEFKNLSHINSSVKSVQQPIVDPAASNTKVRELESQLAAISKAYTELRSIHEELFTEHTKLLNNQ